MKVPPELLLVQLDEEGPEEGGSLFDALLAAFTMLLATISLVRRVRKILRGRRARASKEALPERTDHATLPAPASPPADQPLPPG